MSRSSHGGRWIATDRPGRLPPSWCFDDQTVTHPCPRFNGTGSAVGPTVPLSETRTRRLRGSSRIGSTFLIYTVNGAQTLEMADHH
jgi:hypothetical protein